MPIVRPPSTPPPSLTQTLEEEGGEVDSLPLPPTSPLARPILQHFPSSTSTCTSSSITTQTKRKHCIGDPYAPLICHQPNPHNLPTRPLINRHNSSFERLLSRILPAKGLPKPFSFFSNSQVKPRRATETRMRKRDGDWKHGGKIGEEKGKEKVAIFELELPLEVSRDRSEISYLRRIQSEREEGGCGGRD